MIPSVKDLWMGDFIDVPQLQEDYKKSIINKLIFKHSSKRITNFIPEKQYYLMLPETTSYLGTCNFCRFEYHTHKYLFLTKFGSIYLTEKDLHDKVLLLVRCI